MFPNFPNFNLNKKTNPDELTNENQDPIQDQIQNQNQDQNKYLNTDLDEQQVDYGDDTIYGNQEFNQEIGQEIGQEAGDGYGLAELRQIQQEAGQLLGAEQEQLKAQQNNLQADGEPKQKDAFDRADNLKSNIQAGRYNPFGKNFMGKNQPKDPSEEGANQVIGGSWDV